MAEKKKFTVNRSMQDGGASYDRGDTREMTEADAAPLLASGALSRPGEEPAARDPAVRHTFGKLEGTDPVELDTKASDSRVEGRRSPARRG